MEKTFCQIMTVSVTVLLKMIFFHHKSLKIIGFLCNCKEKTKIQFQ